MNEKTFTNKQTFQQELKTSAENKVPVLPTPPKKKDAKTIMQKLSPYEEEKIKRINDMIEDKKACNNIAVFYKTNPRTMAVGVIVRFFNTFDQDMWCIKGKEFALTLPGFFNNSPIPMLWFSMHWRMYSMVVSVIPKVTSTMRSPGNGRILRIKPM